MFYAPVRKSGETFDVVIPDSEVDRLGLVEGQTVAVEIAVPESKPTLSPDLARIVEEIRRETTPVMQYLKDK